MSNSERELERQASKFLKRHGFNYDGRAREEVSSDQIRFERSFIILSQTDGREKHGRINRVRHR